MASVREETGLSVYRKLLVELSLELSTKDLETLKYAAVDFIPLGRTENMGSGLQFFDALEQDMRIGPRNLTLLQDMFKTIFRVDLAQRIQAFSKERAKFEADGNPNKIVSDKEEYCRISKDGSCLQLWNANGAVCSFQMISSLFV